MKKNLATTLLSIVLVACSSSSKPVAYIENGCYLDSLAGSGALSPTVYVTRKGDHLEAIGWMADVNRGKTPERVGLVLVSEKSGIFKAGEVRAGHDRADVAAAFNKPGLVKSGFVIKFDVKDIPSGTYKVQLNGDYDSFAEVCVSNKEIQVND